MERLTYYLMKGSENDGWYIKPGVTREDAISRLAAYENTGLAPEDISGPWHELFLAECEGRLLVLPYNVGDTVWLIEDPWTGSPLKKPLECEVNAIKKYSHGVYINILFDTRKFNGTRDFNIEYFGKSAFTTREEAEAALKGEGNG